MCAMQPSDPLVTPRPRGNPEQAIAIIVSARRNGRPPTRLSEAIAYIRTVFAIARAAGLDPAIVIAQAALETDLFFDEKWWGVRLNPAGMGITGNLALDELSHTWQSGAAAAISHVAHLYLYAVGDLNASPIPELHPGIDPRYHAFMDAGLRPGFARTIDDLTGTWGLDPDYAQRLAARGNAIFPNLKSLK